MTQPIENQFSTKGDQALLEHRNQMITQGKPLYTFDTEYNANLIAAGAIPLDSPSSLL